MRAYTNHNNNRQTKRGKIKKAVFLIILPVSAVILLSLSFWYFFGRSDKPLEQTTIEVPAEKAKDLPEEEPKPEFDQARLSEAVSGWVSTHPGTYSVVLADQQGTVLASANPDRQFFTASIYKLYVAYVGYQKIDDGTYNAQQPYMGGWTRGKCLDEMIRSSHSPCAEKMWVELGKENLNNKLKEFGLKNTSMTGLNTSAADTAIILARIQRGEGLSEKSRVQLLDSMLGQIYRDALPKGLAPLKVYDKVGFRELVEYHDIGIVQLADGRHLIVSVLTENVGTRNIIGLSQAILQAANHKP